MVQSCSHNPVCIIRLVKVSIATVFLASGWLSLCRVGLMPPCELVLIGVVGVGTHSRIWCRSRYGAMSFSAINPLRYPAFSAAHSAYRLCTFLALYFACGRFEASVSQCIASTCWASSTRIVLVFSLQHSQVFIRPRFAYRLPESSVSVNTIILCWIACQKYTVPTVPTVPMKSYSIGSLSLRRPNILCRSSTRSASSSMSFVMGTRKMAPLAHIRPPWRRRRRPRMEYVHSLEHSHWRLHSLVYSRLHQARLCPPVQT